MKNGLFIFSFIVSLGLAALGLMTAYRLKKQAEKQYASSLFYYDIFLTAFGFYSIWSYLAFQFILDNVITSRDTLLNVVGIFPFMGFPLIIVAWYLYIQFCIELVGKKLKGYISILYFSCFILIFLFLAYYFKNQLVQNEAMEVALLFRSLAIINLVIVLAGSALFLVSKKNTTINFNKNYLALTLIAPVIIASIALFVVSSHWVLIIIFILFYYSHIASPSTYIYFKTQNLPQTHTSNFHDFCVQFEISKRETEIIQEICQGKTNQAIADSLFITVQTVKDHAHRVYTKTGVKNRVQLTNLVRLKIESEPNFNHGTTSIEHQKNRESVVQKN